MPATNTKTPAALVPLNEMNEGGPLRAPPSEAREAAARREAA